MQVGGRHDVRLFKRHNGFDALRNIHYGQVGAADLYGWVGSRHIEIEVKTGSGALRAEQKAWKEMCLRFGVLYIEARSVEDVIGALP